MVYRFLFNWLESSTFRRQLLQLYVIFGNMLTTNMNMLATNESRQDEVNKNTLAPIRQDRIPKKSICICWPDHAQCLQEW
jgi:hypothetical protein